MDDIFFSIIIPTYNPKKFLPRLLDSICYNDCLNNIQVLIVDDISTEPFDEVINKFKSKLQIKIYSNDQHYGFPRYGRQKGLDLAEGKWLCFSDQDDQFIEHAFDKVMAYINEKNIHNYLKCPFLRHSIETDTLVTVSETKGWTHGKFYENAFMKENNIRYDDINYCEDINLSTRMNCFMTAHRIPYYTMPEPVYIWHRRTDSLCDERYFIKAHPDYARGTLGVIVEYLEEFKDDDEIYDIFVMHFLSTLFRLYFYTQSYFFDTLGLSDERVKAALAARPYYERFKKVTELEDKDIIGHLTGQLYKVYHSTREDCLVQVPFIEKLTFPQWIEIFFK